MQYKIFPPGKLQTTITLPPSKSISNRLLIMNALSCSPYPIENLSDCEDTQVLIDAFNSDSNVFDVKGAGTAMRFLTAFLAEMEGEWIIRGNDRMHERPIYPLVNTLIALGAEIEYLEKEGYPPLKIKGRHLKGGEVYLSGNMSSQFVSALLMIAPKMDNGLIIHLENEMISKPYIHLTLGLMEKYGIKAKWEGKDIAVKHQEYVPAPIKVEADWSAASYWYSMVSLIPDAEVTLQGLNKNSLQGDSNLVNLFPDLGVSTEFISDGVIIRKTKKSTKKFFHNFVNEPDLAQTFVVACCLLNVPFLFSGVQSLKIKETDRINALKTELLKLGYVLKDDNEYRMLGWDKERSFRQKDAVIETYNDHRMAMSFTPACIPFGSIIIDNPRVVAKSYPNFWNDLKKAGFTIQEKED
jgi:3-phosphoshikimate 1-carboxyvinyltransferase